MSRKQRWAIRIVTAAAAVILIAAGVTKGGMKDVFMRAVMICLDCIGIG